MGGGRRNLLPAKTIDVEEKKKGYRRDGKDLIDLWKRDKVCLYQVIKFILSQGHEY